MATIDALGLAEDLERAGLPRDQAHGLARALRDHTGEVAVSKGGLHEFGLRLEARFARLEQQIEQKIAGSQGGFITWFTGAMTVQAAAIVALIKLLPGGGP